MKTEGEIRQKLKQVLFRHRKKRLDSLFKPTSYGCVHNASVELTEEAVVGVCGLIQDGRPRGVLCDARFHADEIAKNCPFWEPEKTKDEVKEEFQEILESGNRGLVASNFPDAAALMWVLDDDQNAHEEGIFDGKALEEAQLDEATKGWNWGQWPWSKPK